MSTIIAIENTLEGLPHVRKVGYFEGRGSIYVLLSLDWYAWLTFGWLHRHVIKRAERELQKQVAAGVKVTIGFLP